VASSQEKRQSVALNTEALVKYQAGGDRKKSPPQLQFITPLKFSLLIITKNTKILLEADYGVLRSLIYRPRV
jgi:hypothetical protein